MGVENLNENVAKFPEQNINMTSTVIDHENVNLPEVASENRNGEDLHGITQKVGINLNLEAFFWYI